MYLTLICESSSENFERQTNKFVKIKNHGENTKVH